MPSSINLDCEADVFVFYDKGLLSKTPSGSHLFAICRDGTISRSSLNGGGHINTAEVPIQFSGKLVFDRHITCAQAITHQSLVVGYSNGSVELLNLVTESESINSAVVARLVGQVTCLAVDGTGTMLACASEGALDLKLFNLKTAEFSPIASFPCSHEIKSLSFDSPSASLACVDLSNTVKIFKVSETSRAPTLEKTLMTDARGKSGSYQICWTPRRVLVLLHGDLIVAYDRSTWKSVLQYCQRDQDRIHTLHMASDQLAILGFSSQVALVNVETGTVVCKYAFPDKTFSPVITHIQPAVGYFLNETTGNMSKLSFVIDNGDLYADPASNAQAEEEEEEDAADDLDVDISDTEAECAADANESDIDMDQPGEVVHVNGARQHPVVQPCSTAWRNLQRFLAYNFTGFITARRELDSSLFHYDIEFSDRNSHKPIRFSDEIEFHVAALCETGAVFACMGKLHYIDFGGNRASWAIALPEAYSATASISLNAQHIVLVTAAGEMQIYSLNGLLQHAFICPGRPVSVLCNPRMPHEAKLFCADTDGICCASINLLTGTPNPNANARVLLLEHGSEMLWCGINEAGVLAACSTTGQFVMCLDRPAPRWVSLLSLPVQNEAVWPVYFCESSLSVVYCTDGHPDPYPSPPITEVPYRLPQLPADSSAESYEKVLRSSFVLQSTGFCESTAALTEKERRKCMALADRHLLELAQLSIKTEKASRLLDLARLASSDKTVDLLVQLAQHNRMIALVDELEAYKDTLTNPPRAESPPQSPKVSEAAPASTVTKDAPSLASPAGILANLTPLKFSESLAAAPAAPSSPTLASSPLTSSNPFARAPAVVAESTSGVMVDYISAMMKLHQTTPSPADNDPGLIPLGLKRRAPDENSTINAPSQLASKKQSSLSTFLTSSTDQDGTG